MDLALSEEQAELVATLRSLLGKRADSAAVRAAAASEAGYDADLWRLLCDQVGVAALAVPEEYDGAGFSLVESLLVLEELGRTLAPSPLLASLVTAEALLAGADDDARRRLLPRLAAGEVAALAIADDSGHATTVLEADRASVLVVATPDGLWEADPATTETTWTPAMDQTLRLGTVTLDRARARRIGETPDAALARAAQVGAVGVAALAVGGASQALETTVAYTKERVQFGRPIGSFQALKHRMADLLARVEMARSGSWAASCAVSAGATDADRLAHVAAAYAVDAFRAVAAETIQLHGGIAITWEHDAHLFFKRAHALGHLFGTPAEHRAALSARW